MTPEQELYKANRAKEVLENEAYLEAFESIEKEIIERWKTSKGGEEVARQELWQLLGLLRNLRTVLETTMQGGAVAKAELIHRQSIWEKANQLRRRF